MKAKKDRKLPGYAPLDAMSTFLKKARVARTPERVDAELLRRTYQITGNPYYLVTALKYLGLIDETGKPTEKYRLIQVGGEDFKANLEKLVRDAYSDLFQKLDIAKATRTDIHNYFSVNYSPALAERAARLFIGLCQEAGIIPPEKFRGKKVTVRTLHINKKEKIPPVEIEQRASDEELFKFYLRRLIESIPSLEIGPGITPEVIKQAEELRRKEFERIEKLLSKIGKQENKEGEGD